MSALIAEFIAELIEVALLLDDAKEVMDGAKDAAKGKKPFMGPDKMQAQLAKLNAHGNKLSALAAKGLGQPLDKQVTMDELANPKTRSGAEAKIKESLKARDKFLADGRKLLESLKQTETEALARSKAAREIKELFKKLVESPLPDLGTVGKSTYFGYFQLFEAASGTFGNIASYAKKGQARVSTDLSKVEQDTENMRTTFKTFGVK